MKLFNLFISLLTLVFFSNILIGQTVIYSEDFSSGSSWTLNTVIGPEDSNPNVWYISCQEDGEAPGNCGSACAISDNSLHVGADAIAGGDLGAAYAETGFNLTSTNRRAESGDISTMGQTNLTLSFDMIGNGGNLQDFCELFYSTNGGATWISLATPLTSLCCGGAACNGTTQGLWQNNSYTLPAACENIPNLRIGFVWTNFDDGIATDPSFAVDDITITTPSSGPTVTADFTLNPTSPICEGTTVTFTDASTNTGTTITSWAWNFDVNSIGGAAPSTASGQGPHAVTFNTAGTYDVELTVSDGSITDTKTISLVVNAAANAGPDNSDNVCNNGGSTTIDLNTLLSGADPGGVWTETTGTPSGQFTTATGVFDGNGLPTNNIYTFDYTVAGTSPCPNDVATITITVIDCSSGSITADFTMNPNIAICEGETITFTDASSATGTTITSWLWNFDVNSIGGAAPSTANGQGPHTITFNTAGTYDIELSASDGTISDSKTIQITVNALPAVTAVANPSTTLCTGDMVTLNGAGAATYTWDNSVVDGTAFTPPSGSTTYTVIGVDANGCSNTATIVLNVTDCAPLIAGFAFQDDICLGDCIEFTDTSSGNPVDWVWDFGSNATPQNANGQDPGTICFNTVGVHQIQLTITDAGGNSASTTQNLTVHDIPSVIAEYDTIIDLGGEVQLIATSTNFGNYLWTPNDYYIDCDTCATTFAVPELDVNYIVTLTDPNGCSARDTVYVKVNFIEGIGVPQAFSPNGDGNNDLLVVKGLGIDQMVFKIYNRYGQLVFESTEQTFGWDGTFKGKDENPGVFTWVLEYHLINGTSRIISGNTTLIR